VIKHFLLYFFCCVSRVQAEEGLEAYLDGFLSSHEIAAKLVNETTPSFHIVTYLEGLNLKDTSRAIPANLEYDLWRHFCDCHHFCQIFYHQTYIIDKELPVVKILDSAFNGFEKAATGEGGVWVNKGFEFLQTIDPHEKARQEALGNQ